MTFKCARRYAARLIETSKSMPLRTATSGARVVMRRASLRLAKELMQHVYYLCARRYAARLIETHVPSPGVSTGVQVRASLCGAPH